MALGRERFRTDYGPDARHNYVLNERKWTEEALDRALCLRRWTCRETDFVLMMDHQWTPVNIEITQDSQQTWIFLSICDY